MTNLALPSIIYHLPSAIHCIPHTYPPSAAKRATISCRRSFSLLCPPPFNRLHPSPTAASSRYPPDSAIPGSTATNNKATTIAA